ALLQINDPDPYVWIPIYGVVALICFFNARKKYDRFSHLCILACCIIYGINLVIKNDGVISWFNDHEAENLVQSMKATKPWIENTREFGGLLIITLVTSVNIFKHKKAGA
ncbi:MAG: hypothetical protein RL152_1099, partial [Bacteroidota bacterium]